MDALRKNHEFREILTRFAGSDWELIAGPSRDWLAGTGDIAALVAAIRQADAVCGACGCDFDPLYKRALVLAEEPDA